MPIALGPPAPSYRRVRRASPAAGPPCPADHQRPGRGHHARPLHRPAGPGAAGVWARTLRPARTSRGFAEELRDLLLRAAERGLDGPGLARLGRQAKREEWIAAGAFLERYAARFDLAPVPAYDYGEIIRIAAAMLTRSAVRAREREAYAAVVA